MAKAQKPQKPQPDANGMLTVRALVGERTAGGRVRHGVSDNGHRYAAGEEFHMHVDLIAAHVEAGLIEVAGA